MPLFNQCGFFDFSCIDEPWLYGDNGTFTDPGGEDDFDENWDEVTTMCPKPSSSSSGSSTVSPTPVQSQPPKESPREGDPMKNKADCYGSGQKTEHVRIDNTINSFCNTLGKPGTILKENFFFTNTYTLPNSGGGLGVKIVTSLAIDKGCQWTWNSDECHRYMKVPVDSCNCGGVNGKQGGIVRNDCYQWRVDPNTDWG